MEVSGTGASTLRIPSADSADMILVTSVPSGSLKTAQPYLRYHQTQCKCWNAETNVYLFALLSSSEHFRDKINDPLCYAVIGGV